VSLFVWLLPFDLSGLGDPTSSYATAGIALRVAEDRKLPHHVTSCMKRSYSETALGENKSALKVKKVKLTLSTPQEHTGGCMRFSPHLLFTSVPDKDERPTSRPGRFIP